MSRAHDKLCYVTLWEHGRVGAESLLFKTESEYDIRAAKVGPLILAESFAECLPHNINMQDVELDDMVAFFGLKSPINCLMYTLFRRLTDRTATYSVDAALK
jgi:hypothetical protein